MNNAILDNKAVEALFEPEKVLSKHDMITEAFVALANSKSYFILDNAFKTIKESYEIYVPKDSYLTAESQFNETRNKPLDDYRKELAQNKKIDLIKKDLRKEFGEVFNALLKFDSNIDLHERISVTYNETMKSIRSYSYRSNVLSDSELKDVAKAQIIYEAFSYILNEMNSGLAVLPFKYALNSKYIITDFSAWTKTHFINCALSNMLMVPLPLVQDEVSLFLAERNKLKVLVTRDDVRNMVLFLKKNCNDFESFNTSYFSRYYKSDIKSLALLHALFELSNSDHETVKINNYLDENGKLALILGSGLSNVSDNEIEELWAEITQARAADESEVKIESNNFLGIFKAKNRRQKSSMEEIVERLDTSLSIDKTNSKKRMTKDTCKYSRSLVERFLSLANINLGCKITVKLPRPVIQINSHVELMDISPETEVFKALRSGEDSIESNDEFTVKGKLKRLKELDPLKVISGLTDLNYVIIEPSVAQVKYVSNLMKMVEESFKIKTINLSDEESIPKGDILKSVVSVRTQNLSTAIAYAQKAAILFDGKSATYANTLAERNSGELIEVLERLDSNIVYLAFGLARI